MKIYHSLLGVAATLMLLSSCGDYLDEQPSVSSDVPVTESTHLLALCDYINDNIYSINYFAFYCTDDTDIPKEMYAGDAWAFDLLSTIAPYCHYGEGIALATTDYFWKGEYAKIYTANLIIESAPEVTGDAKDIQEALANAYFMRAYSFFDLATHYCQPWCEKNKNELGLPLRLKLDFTETLSRGTLEQTYAQIFADLKAAEELVSYDAVDAKKPWRVSKCAINALYSRIYLARGEYEEALKYTNAALNNAPELFDYNSLQWGSSSTIEAMGNLPTQTLEYCETNTWSTTKFLYYQEWIYPRLTRNLSQTNIPSRELVNLYDHENDLRFVYFFVEHGVREFGITYDWYNYSQFSSGRYMIGGLCISELLLNKAEILVRTGDWSNGLSVLTALREARYVTGTAVALTASNQSEALKVVLEERRRELPFAFRFGDIKRFAVNETNEDDVSFTRDFYEMNSVDVDTSKSKIWSISGNSPTMAIPINQTEINDSRDVIEQNPF